VIFKIEPEIFPGCHPEKNPGFQNLIFLEWPPELFSDLSYKPSFFSRVEILQKSRFAEPELFLGF
jgi:hypothetical protein